MINQILFGLISLFIVSIFWVGSTTLALDSGLISNISAKFFKEDTEVKSVGDDSSKSSSEMLSDDSLDIPDDSARSAAVSGTFKSHRSDDELEIEFENEDSEDDEDEDEDESDDRNRGTSSSQGSAAQAVTPVVPAPSTPKPTTGAGSNGVAPASMYTMAQVAAHNTKASCYTAISGYVYDLTSFVSNHPGGQAAIASICGVDGTSAFSGQHGGQGRPANELAGLKIGVVAK